MAAWLLLGVSVPATAATPDTKLVSQYIDAATNGSRDEVQALLQKIGVANVDVQNSFGQTAFSEAISHNPDPAVAMMLLRAGAAPEKRGSPYGLPLTFAVQKNDLALVEEMARRGVIDKSDDHGAYALEVATTPAMKQLLLKYGAVNAQVIQTLVDTARHGSAAQVAAQLKALPTGLIDARAGGQSENALIAAIKDNPDPEVAKLLLRAGASPVKAEYEGTYETPLMLAVARHRIDLINALAAHGAIRDSADHGALALESAGSPDIIAALTAGGARWDASSPGLLRSFIETARSGTPAQLETILGRIGVSRIDEKDRDGRTALAQALNHNPDPAVALFLLDHGAKAAGPLDPYAELLRRAADKNDSALVRQLAQRGAITRSQDHGARAFETAHTREMATLLLQLGADVSHEVESGSTPLLHFARRDYEGGHQTTAQILALIDAGADVRASEESGYTALHYCAQSNNLACAKALLAHGADANAHNEGRATPLMAAVSNTWAAYPKPGVRDPGAERESMVALLLEHGADPNLGTSDGGGAPLTSVYNSPALTRLLLAAGADPNGPRFWNETALDRTRLDDPEVADLLIKAGAGTPTQRLLSQLGLPPNLINRIKQIAINLLPVSGLLAPMVIAIGYLLVFAVSSRWHQSLGHQSAAAGAAWSIVAFLGYCFTIFAILKQANAGELLAYALLPITVLSWIVVAAAYFVARRVYLRGHSG